MAGEGAQQQGVEGCRGAHAPGTKLGRNNPLDEVEAALKAAPLADCETPREPQRFGHAAGELEVPPASAALAFEIEGTQSPLTLDSFQDGARHFAMLAQDIAPPGVHLVLPPPPREAWIEGERQPARFVAPVLEQRRFGCKQRLSESGVEAVKPGGEHDAVGASSAHRDGVELQVAEVLDDPVATLSGLGAARTGAIGETKAERREQTGTGKGEPPRLRDADGLGLRGHARERQMRRLRYPPRVSRVEIMPPRSRQIDGVAL